MRKIQILILLIITINSCSGQDYAIESKYFDCLVEISYELDIDLKQELAEFENHLIGAKVLYDKSGESYYQIYKTIEKKGDINFSFDYSFVDSIKTHMDTFATENMITDCIALSEKLEKTKKYKKSKINKLKKVMDSIKTSGNFNISETASKILKILSPKDFEHNYYKMATLLLLATTQDAETGITRNLPPIPKDKEKEPVKKRNRLSVYVTANNDSVKLNKDYVSIDDLSDIVKKYILSDSKDTSMPELIPKHIELLGDCYQSKLTIFFDNEKSASYDTYMNVQKQLNVAYKKARDTKALEYFDLEFNKLTTNQQSSIKKLVPKRISEAEPER